MAERIAAHARARGQRALLIAGEHEYDVRLEGQLRLPRGDDVWLWRADASWVLRPDRAL